MNPSFIKLFTLFQITSLFAVCRAQAAGVVTEVTELNLRSVLAGGGMVTFAVDGVITLANTISITNTTTIDGSGHNVTISGNGSVQVLFVNGNGKLILRHLTIANGNAATAGGGLNNFGNTTITDCTFSNNVAVQFGGGIYHGSSAVLTVNNSTFVGNSATYSGGAIAVNSFANPNVNGARLTNCTFFGNGTIASGGGVSFGGNLTSTSRVVNCTFAWNTNGAMNSIVGSGLPGAVATVINSIFAHGMTNTSYGVSNIANVAGVIDLGRNISTDTTPSPKHLTTITNTDPLLGPFTDNGGPTWTLAILTPSPGIDAATNVGVTVDQRGITRPYGTTSDIGAFEWMPPFVFRGQVRGSMPGEVITVSLGTTTLTTTNGFFNFPGQSPGTYTVSPSNSAYVFVPAGRYVTVGPDKLNVDFTAYRRNTLTVDSIIQNTLSLVHAGTNGQVIRLLASTNTTSWIAIATNTVTTNDITAFSTTLTTSMCLYRTERIP